MKLIAHYCGTGYFPGATLAAARHSMENGADRIEMDVRFTKDMCPVISHDEDTRAVFGVDRRIRDMSAEEFTGLRYGQDPALGGCRLSDMLEGGVRTLLLHLKEEGEREMEILRDVLGDADAVMGVESVENALRVRRLMPEKKILAFMERPEDLDEFAGLDVEYIRLWEEWITEERVRKIRASGKQWWVMVNDPTLGGCGYTTADALCAFRRAGADAALVNDIPWAVQTLQDR